MRAKLDHIVRLIEEFGLYDTSVPTLIKQIQLVSGTLGEKSVAVLVK